MGFAFCGTAQDIVTGNSDGSVVRAQDGVDETLLQYSILLYGNGDAEVDCTAALGSAQEGTGSAYYPSLVPGAQTGNCSAIANYPSASDVNVGYWRFTAFSPVRVEYLDADNPESLDGFVYIFQLSECRGLRMGADGAWMDTSLSEALQ